MTVRPAPGLLCTVLAVALALGCGGNSSGNEKDAATDAPHQLDLGLDAPMEDAAGPVCRAFTEPNGCGFELTSCNTVKSNSDECGNDLDCVDTNLYGYVCLKRCNCSAECGLNTICLPAKASSYNTGYATYVGEALGHCYFSFCGLAGDTSSPVGNGSFFGSCTLGSESYIKATAAVQTRPGTCLPVFTNPEPGYLKFGLCQETGTKKRGESCSYDTNQCYEPATFDSCTVGNVCTHHQGESTGTCAKMCNPHADGFTPAIAGDCAADGDVTYDQYCQDSSDYQWKCAESSYDGGLPTYDSVVVRNYFGFCVDTPACDVFASASNCTNVVSDGGVPLPGCEPTNPVSSYGLCSKVGTVPLGGTCNDSLLCQDKLVCITDGNTNKSTCEKYCGLGVNDGKWPCDTGEFCDPILYGSNPAGCWNDPWSLAFGICRPDTRQDGGTDGG